MRKGMTPLAVLAGGLLALSLSACDDTGANENEGLTPTESGTVDDSAVVDTDEVAESDVEE